MTRRTDARIAALILVLDAGTRALLERNIEAFRLMRRVENHLRRATN